MPITLEDIPAADETTVPPLRVWVWLLLLLLCLLAGALYGWLFWPAGKPVMTLAWWSRVLIWPLCGYAALLGMRLWWHDHCHNAVLDWNADRETLLAEETLRGQQPLYLYAIAQQCALGSDGLAARLLAGDSALTATAIDGVGHVICARFPVDFLAIRRAFRKCSSAAATSSCSFAAIPEKQCPYITLNGPVVAAW